MSEAKLLLELLEELLLLQLEVQDSIGKKQKDLQVDNGN